MTKLSIGARREMRAAVRLSFLAAGLLVFAGVSRATSIIPISDAELARRADVVVHGIVLSNQVSVDDHGRPETLTFIQPISILKGSISGTLVLHQLGGELPDGRFFKMWGRPEYVDGSEVVVFAIARPEGEWQTAEMMLGKFDVQADETGRLFAVPSLAAMAGHSGVNIVGPERVNTRRSLEAEAANALEDGNGAGSRAATRVIEREPLAPKLDVSPRELSLFAAAVRSSQFSFESRKPAGALVPVTHTVESSGKHALWSNINGNLYRWNNFATTAAGWTVTDTALMTGGGTTEAMNAIATWTNDPNSVINYTVSSGTANIIDLSALSSPCGWSTCLPPEGGVIGCGGPQGIGGSNTLRGETYGTITSGMANLRTFCSANIFSSTIVQSVLTHELGHSLGLGHSEESDPADTIVSPHDVCAGDEDAAIMRWTVQNRTTLGTDDQDAIRWIYGDGGNHCTNVPLTINSVTASPTLPKPTGTPITWTANTTGGTAPLSFRFYRYSAAAGWVMVRDYAAGNTYSWTPGATEGGQYDIAVWVKNSGSSAAFDAVLDGGTFTITGGVNISSVVPSPALPKPTGTTITFTANATGTPAPLQYRFYRFSAASGWVMVRDYATANSYSWTPGSSEAGQYDIAVWVKAAGSANQFDAVLDTGTFTITGGVTISSLVASPTLPRSAGTPITWTATASGTPGPLLYRFWRYSAASGWVIAQDYSTTNTLAWTPSQSGQYDITVWVKTNGSANAFDAVLDGGFFTITP